MSEITASQIHRRIMRSEVTERINPDFWRCDGCGAKTTDWGETWGWWGSIMEWDENRMLAVRVSCSEACLPAAKKRKKSLNFKVRF